VTVTYFTAADARAGLINPAGNRKIEWRMGVSTVSPSSSRHGKDA
jgi:hypothetical protein